MARIAFDQELQDLEKRLEELGGMVEEALVEAVDALKRHDLEKARQIIEADRSVNERRYAIERETFVLIATQQPMAVDLRTLAAVLEIATELERIGDYAKGIARITLKMGSGALCQTSDRYSTHGRKGTQHVAPSASGLLWTGYRTGPRDSSRR